MRYAFGIFLISALLLTACKKEDVDIPEDIVTGDCRLTFYEYTDASGGLINRFSYTYEDDKVVRWGVIYTQDEFERYFYNSANQLDSTYAFTETSSYGLTKRTSFHYSGTRLDSITCRRRHYYIYWDWPYSHYGHTLYYERVCYEYGPGGLPHKLTTFELDSLNGPRELKRVEEYTYKPDGNIFSQTTTVYGSTPTPQVYYTEYPIYDSAPNPMANIPSTYPLPKSPNVPLLSISTNSNGYIDSTHYSYTYNEYNYPLSHNNINYEYECQE